MSYASVTDTLANVAWKRGAAFRAAPAAVIRMADLEKRFGKLLCPCQFVPEDAHPDALTPCPCDKMEEDCKTKGACHCGLFVRKEGE